MEIEEPLNTPVALSVCMRSSFERYLTITILLQARDSSNRVPPAPERSGEPETCCLHPRLGAAEAFSRCLLLLPAMSERGTLHQPRLWCRYVSHHGATGRGLISGGAGHTGSRQAEDGGPAQETTETPQGDQSQDGRGSGGQLQRTLQGFVKEAREGGTYSESLQQYLCFE